MLTPRDRKKNRNNCKIFKVMNVKCFVQCIGDSKCSINASIIFICPISF